MKLHVSPTFPKSFYNLSFSLSSFNTKMVNCPNTVFKDVMRDSLFKQCKLICSISVLCSSALFFPLLLFACLPWTKLIYFLFFEVLFWIPIQCLASSQWLSYSYPDKIQNNSKAVAPQSFSNPWSAIGSTGQTLYISDSSHWIKKI